MARCCGCNGDGNPKGSMALHGILFGKPNEIFEEEPCRPVVQQVWENVTVEISKCEVCGKIHFSWYRQEDTNRLDPDEFMLHKERFVIPDDSDPIMD